MIIAGATLTLILLGLLGLRFAVAPLLEWWVPRRLGPYEIEISVVDPALPERLDAPRSVAVIGAGLAGIAAASTLAKRGFAVTVFEKNAFIGGKIGAFSHLLASGESVPISHGFHAFFRHYYNLNRFLDELELRSQFAAVSDYTIIDKDGDKTSFAALPKLPVRNLLGLADHKVFRYRDVLFGPARDLMGIFLEYRAKDTFAGLDHLSFADFAERARLPPRLKVAFNTFSRAFFADESKLSLAELVKCFHFYFLGHDGGLVYDYPVRDYEPALLAPIRAHLTQLGVELRLETPVTRLERDGQGFVVNDQTFEHVVLAADAAASRAIVASAETLRQTPATERVAQLRAGQRYAVMRLWLDRDLRTDLPVFLITDREILLDAVAVYHRLEHESAAYAKAHGGSVLELHSYAVPDHIGSEQEIRDSLVLELRRFFPELAEAEIQHEVLHVRADFTAFHVGLHAARPGSDSGVPGLYFAGDWVKLEFPAMLMEGAFASGLVAANRILADSGLRSARITSVPLEGVMAGWPAPPSRRALLR